MSQQKPSVGRIVHYLPTCHSDKGQPWPAIITHVWSDTCVNLRVVEDPTFEIRWLRDAMTSSVSQSDDPDKPTPGTWQWPPRV